MILPSRPRIRLLQVLAGILAIYSSRMLIGRRNHVNSDPTTWAQQQQTTSKNHNMYSMIIMSSDPSLFIGPGELPGYTGWARPSWTLAGAFEVTKHYTTSMRVGDIGTWTLLCQHELCNHVSGDSQHSSSLSSSSWFYVRAYGPSIITGHVVQNEDSNRNEDDNGTEYTVILQPWDTGVYTVEVILTFSQAPNPNTYPHAANLGPVLYEGYALPGFPWSIDVQESRVGVGDDDDSKRTCTLEQLVLTTRPNANKAARNALISGPEARWIVIDNVGRTSHTSSAHNVNNNNLTMFMYRNAYSSLGVMFEYVPVHCRLLTFPTPLVVPTSKTSKRTSNPFRCLLRNQDASGGRSSNSPALTPAIPMHSSQSQSLHVLMIGDSVMRLQSDMLDSMLMEAIRLDKVELPVSKDVVELYGGILRSDRKTGPHLSDLEKQYGQLNLTQKKRIIILNSGLHDIHRLCSAEYANERTTYLNDMELHESSCTEMYVKAIRLLFQTVSRIPANAVIFQTTTAAWPKHGNFGVAWDPRYGQGLPLDAGFVQYFNQLALEAFLPFQQAYNQWYAVDAFDISYARPDHREVDTRASIGKKLSHPGPQVVHGMVTLWLMIMLQIACPDDNRE